VEEFLTLGFKKRSGVFIQKEVEEYVPHFVHGVGRWSVVRNHREEEYVPRFGTSAFPLSVRGMAVWDVPRMAGSTSQQVKSSVRLP
jgi:hypothetical protein